jgi:hypothetical protein
MSAKQAHRFYQREGFEKSHVKLVRYFNERIKKHQVSDPMLSALP